LPVDYKKKEQLLQSNDDWFPSDQNDMITMAETWVDTIRRTAWGIPAEEVDGLGAKAAAARAILAQSKTATARTSLTRSRSGERGPEFNTAVARIFGELEYRMQYLKDCWLCTPPLTTEDYKALLLPVPGDETEGAVPREQPVADLIFSGSRAELRDIRPADGTAVDSRIHYGVTISYGLSGKSTGLRPHRLSAPPASAHDLSYAKFTRRRHESFDFGGESGNTVWFCLRYESSGGSTGPFGPIFSAVIP
jgi:hypothetical protein